MKILIVILSLQIAFPSLGYGLINSIGCHSSQSTEISCCEKSTSTDDKESNKESHCGDNCSCACCFLLQICVKDIKLDNNFESDFVMLKSDFKETVHFSLFSSGIWQPPKRII